MKKLSFLSIFSAGYREILFSYRPRIDPVSIPYRSRINPVSFSYHPPIVLLSFSLPEAETIRKRYGNNTKPIYLGREDDMRMRLSGYLEVGLLRSKTRCWRCARNTLRRVSDDMADIYPPQFKIIHQYFGIRNNLCTFAAF